MIRDHIIFTVALKYIKNIYDGLFLFCVILSKLLEVETNYTFYVRMPLHRNKFYVRMPLHRNKFYVRMPLHRNKFPYNKTN